MSKPSNKNKLQRIFRWRGIYFLGATTFVLAAYLKWGFDPHLKTFLEHVGADLNNAQVNIGDLKTNFLSGSMVISELQVAHHVNPMRNLVEIDKINVAIEFEPLLRRKLVIKTLALEGVHYGGPRRDSGTIDLEAENGYQPASFIDRVASGFFSGIKEQLNDNPLKYLGQLATGLNVTPKVDGLKKEFASKTLLKEKNAELESDLNQWDAWLRELPDKEFITAQIKRMDALYKSARMGDDEQLERLKNALTDQKKTLVDRISSTENRVGRVQKKQEYYVGVDQQVEKTLENDVSKLLKQLGLPRVDYADLSAQLFGSKILAYLERIAYLADLTRRRMPKGTREGPMLMVARPKGSGTSIHYGKLAGNPTFLINDGTISSQATQDVTHGTVKGTIQGITSDPAIYGHPAHIAIDAEFAKVGLMGAHIEFTADHTKDEFSEEFLGNIASFPISDWVLTDTGDLQVKLASAQGSLSFSARFHENEVKAEWKLSLVDAQYSVISRHKQLEESLAQIFNNVHAFDMVGNVSGPLDSLSFEASSELGKTVAQGIREEFRYQLGAIDDTVKKEIQDQIGPERLTLESRLKDISDRVLPSLEIGLNNLQELDRYTDKSLARLEDGTRWQRGLSSARASKN